MGTNIIIILLIIGVIEMFYDEDYTNDHFGGVFLVLGWIVRSMFNITIGLKEGDKKSVLFDVGLVVISCVLLFVFSMKYFF
ncbi:hypothetical protein [Bacillus wiedmannii]|uniref:hypothetical protein n=1 Tax=Bacillus wiedmannii TaxID=1890302 RepID=UPI001EFA14F2|nr:hypothetical protein [Bacillus wiedmannii]MCQ6544404.1 hypothetical protein [Bacillus wiedmannii]MCQ6571298.1 hypothetical protein [Bacillus wiedmannii]MCU5573498.1 hypothetical protein [Bacillus wiedmannii]MDM5269691.1 hypothetical protein [Bacillus wiedmannii]WMS84852.1 hypothetical protein RE438_23775 [Bacillus wiedmannii]